MRRNCIYRYLNKNRVLKDLIVYEDKNPQLYLLNHTGNSCYQTFSFKNAEKKEQIVDNNLLDLIWTKSNIISTYEKSGRLYVQVCFGK